MPPVAKPWFRMYSDVLDNIKAESLSDKQFRFWVKLLGLANVSTPRGHLPPVSTIAFRTRMSQPTVIKLIGELAVEGLIDDDLTLHDWDEWQAERDVTLSRRTSRDSHANVTLMSQDRHDRVEKSREEEKRVEPEGEITVPVVRAFERCFGRLLAPMEIESIKALDEEHPRERIDYALREAADLGKRSVRYVQTICENQAQNGDDHERKQMGRDAGGVSQARSPAPVTAASYGLPNVELPVFVPLAGTTGMGSEGVARVDDQARVEVR